MEIKLRKNHFVLSPQRAIYWIEQKALILSDLHFGKSMHFRKEGIAVPKQIFDDDLQRLNDLISEFKPGKVIIVGDLFHSRHNNEVHVFDIWRSQYENLEMHLVKGNHDILGESRYKEMNIRVTEVLEIRGFFFSHEPVYTKMHFSFCGHIHPGIVLRGQARQSLKFPCFYFSRNICILPAFGKFTGLAMIQPDEDDRIYAIVQNKIVEL